MSKYDCPVCGQYMDFIVVSHKTKPFVDGKCYPKMCFGCFHTPLLYVTNYKPDGSVDEVVGPNYSFRQLNTPNELYENGSTSSLKEAYRCVECVKRCCREVGAKALDRLKLRRPEPDYELNEEYEEQQVEAFQRRKKKRT